MKFFYIVACWLALSMGFVVSAQPQKASARELDPMAPTTNRTVTKDKPLNWIIDFDKPYSPPGQPTLFPNAKPVPQKYVDLIKSRVTPALLDQKGNVQKEHVGKVTWKLMEVRHLQLDKTVFLAASWSTNQNINLNSAYSEFYYVSIQYLTINNDNIIYEEIDGEYVFQRQNERLKYLLDRAWPKNAKEDYRQPDYDLPVWLIVKSDGKPSIVIESYNFHTKYEPRIRVFDINGALSGHMVAAGRAGIGFDYLPKTGKVNLGSHDNYKMLFPVEKQDYQIDPNAVAKITSYKQGASALRAMRCKQRLPQRDWRCNDTSAFEALILRLYSVDSTSQLKPMRGKEYGGVLQNLNSIFSTEQQHTHKFVLDDLMTYQSPPHIYEVIRFFSLLETLEDPNLIRQSYEKVPAEIRKTLEPKAFALLLAAFDRPFLLPVFNKP